jgi:hypothetical protein
VCDQGGIYALHVVTLMDYGSPPGGLQIVLQLHSQRAIIVDSLQPAVDVSALEYEPSSLAKGDYVSHGQLADVSGHLNPRK